MGSDNILEKRKTIAFRSDPQVMAKFEEFLRSVRDTAGEKILKEEALQFLMDYCAELKPKEFLKLFYAYKAKKFSKK